MSTLRKCAAGVIGAVMAASPLLAHHDWPVDRTKLITVTGTVIAYIWADPHVMIALDVQANGTIEKWKVGGSSKKNSAVNGWDKHTLKPGDVITGIGSCQSSLGLSTRSIMWTSTGPSCGSSLSPSCSWTAVKIEGPPATGGGGTGSPAGKSFADSNGFGSGVHSRLTS